MRKITQWTGAYTEAESLDILCDLAEAAALESGSERGRMLAKAIRKGRLREVCDYEIPYAECTTHEAALLRQAQAFFQKLEFLDLGIDKEKAALDSFLDAERRCKYHNVKWDLWHDGVIGQPSHVAGVFHRATRIVSRILGPRPEIADLKLRFGPGATSLTKKRESSVKRKLGKGVSCSDDLIGGVKLLLSEMPHLAELHAEQSVMSDEEFWGIVPVHLHMGAISFVVKNYKTYRTTETQPTLNGMLQLAIGDFMFERARRVVGLDLRDQTLNQRLARIGSLTGALATLDLKSASNLNCVSFIRSMLPEDWYSLLSMARCGTTKVPGIGAISLEMFSGMGNGFTFPLQSIVFYALARACGEATMGDNPITSVYGDDIIVDTPTYSLLKEVLEWAGHIVNDQKSFKDGPFRESCGADFLRGTNIRPVYVKEILTPAVLFSLHNGLVRNGRTELAERVRKYVHPALALTGPDGYGDGHLIGDWTPVRRKSDIARGFGGFSFYTYQHAGKRDWTYHPGDRILHTYSAEHRGAKKLFTEQIPGIDAVVTARRPWGFCRFARAWATGHSDVEEVVAPLPFGEDPTSWGPVLLDEDGIGIQGRAKACSFPGTDGYKKVMVYTLEAPE